MTITITQADFIKQSELYLNRIAQADEILRITRPDQEPVVILSQACLTWLRALVQADEESLTYAIARDQLIRHQLLQDDNVAVSNDQFWHQF